MPQTLMNLSGEAVTEAMRFYKLKPEQVLVMLDDITLPVGVIRIRRKGSDGGQRGCGALLPCRAASSSPIKIGVRPFRVGYPEDRRGGGRAAGGSPLGGSAGWGGPPLGMNKNFREGKFFVRNDKGNR